MSKHTRKGKAARKQVNQYGARIKGGVGLFPDGWKTVVHIWDNIEAAGEPDRVLVGDQAFQSESEALTHYQNNIRPGLMKARDAVVSKYNVETYNAGPSGQG